MAAFNGRRAPNVSQYVANLNAIPSAHDVALQQQEGFSLDDDLAMFTNTEFFDFDLGDTAVAAPVPPQHDEARGLDFLNGTSFTKVAHQSVNHFPVLTLNDIDRRLSICWILWLGPERGYFDHPNSCSDFILASELGLITYRDSNIYLGWSQSWRETSHRCHS